MARSKASPTSSKKPRINGAKKGKQFERDVANALGHIFPNAERMLEYQASGNIGVDIKGTGCFKIQCKRNANYAPIGKIHEVRTEDPNDIPVLVTKGNHLAPMAVVPFEALIRMLEVMHGMTPLLAKPEDTSTKAIHDKSAHLADAIAFKTATRKIIDAGVTKMSKDLEVIDHIGIAAARTQKENIAIANKALNDIGRQMSVPIISTDLRLFNLPVVIDEDLTDTELTIKSTLRGAEVSRLLHFDSGDIVEGIISELDKHRLLGHDIISLHCADSKWLELACTNKKRYPIVTSEITSLSELI